MTEEKALEQLEHHMDGCLDAAYHRLGMMAPRHNGRPMMAHIRAELPPAEDDEVLIWLEAWRAFLRLLFEAGPRPDRVLKRLYALTWAVDREKLAHMSQTELAELLGETRAAMQQRIKLVYNDQLSRMGFRGTRVPGQNTETTCRKLERAQKGNTNRRNGRRKGDH